MYTLNDAADKAVLANGFSVTSPKFGAYSYKPFKTFGSPEEAGKSQEDWDYLLVSTKALPDVSDDSALLEGLVGPNTAIVLVQNGLGVEDAYRRRFLQASILSAVTIVSAAPHLDKGGAGPSGNDERASDQNVRFVQLLQAGGIDDAEAYDHAELQFVRWHKIAIKTPP